MSKERAVIQFGNEVRSRRQALNLSLEELAERADLTPGFIGSIENGLRDPSLSTMTKLAHGLGAPVGALLGPIPVFGPKTIEFAKLFDQAPREIQAGLLTILRGVAKLVPKGPTPPRR